MPESRFPREEREGYAHSGGGEGGWPPWSESLGFRTRGVGVGVNQQSHGPMNFWACGKHRKPQASVRSTRV